MSVDFERWSGPGAVAERAVRHRGKQVAKVIRISEKVPKKNGFYYKTQEYEVVFFPPRLDDSFEVSTEDHEGDGRQAWWAVERKIKSILA